MCLNGRSVRLTRKCPPPRPPAASSPPRSNHFVLFLVPSPSFSGGEPIFRGSSVRSRSRLALLSSTCCSEEPFYFFSFPFSFFFFAIFYQVALPKTVASGFYLQLQRPHPCLVMELAVRVRGRWTHVLFLAPVCRRLAGESVTFPPPSPLGDFALHHFLRLAFIFKAPVEARLPQSAKI